MVTHGVADTVPENPYVLWHLSLVRQFINPDGHLQPLGQDGAHYYLLAFLRLWGSLSEILTHVPVIACTEADDGLLALVADVEAYQHGLWLDLVAELHSPEISAPLCVHLSDNIGENAVVLLFDCAVGDKLGETRAVSVDLIFNEGIEFGLVACIWHDHHKDEVGMLDISFALADYWTYLLCIVVLDALREGLSHILFLILTLVAYWTNVCILNKDFEALRTRDGEELVVDILGVLYILF